MLDRTLIRGTAGVHPARRLAWDELHAGLQRGVEAGHIYRSAEGDLCLYTYSHSVVYENGWDEFSVMARGLIVRPSTKEILATPFPKFFNYAEAPDAVPNESFTTTVKMDGSLGVIWHDGSNWRVTTKGGFSSEQAIWGQTWLRTNVDLTKLVVGTTYLTEIIYPENRIVIRYTYEGLTLLAGYDVAGNELTRGQLRTTGMALVEEVSFASIEDMLAAAETLGNNQEGWVVRFTHGIRVKIKGAEYLRIHRVVSNCTPLAIWDVLRKMDDIDGIRRMLPEEFWVDFDLIRGLLENSFAERVGRLRLGVVQVAHLSDKELGLALRSLPMAEDVKSCLFAARKSGFLDLIAKPGKSRDKFFDQFRPTANRLQGYRASALMNRATEPA